MNGPAEADFVWSPGRVLTATLLSAFLLAGGCKCDRSDGAKELTAVIEATSPVVADGVRTSVMTATLTDGDGAPAVGVTVAFATDRGSNDLIQQPDSPTDSQGRVTGRVASTLVGTSVVSLTADGEALTATASIEFIASGECTSGDTEACYTGPSGTENEGACVGGTRDCGATGTWGPCNGETLPAANDATCDQVDDDCDGRTDEDTDPTAAETCDGTDEDCDGTIDEGFDFDGDGFTTCGTVAGGGLDPNLADCNDLDVNVFPGATENCDGVDEDCDGTTDEGAVPPGGLCLTLGVCAGTVESCLGGGWSCLYGPDYVDPETNAECDGLDNDCDGSTDEASCSCTLGQQVNCSTDVGECVAGVQDCVGGTFGACSGILPAAESCNGLDDDCDSFFDNGLDTDGDGFTTCGTVPGGGTDPNLVDCAEGDGSVYPGAPETCNNVDDDCDGTTDEGMDATCDDGTFCNGVESCQAGVCTPGTAPACDDGVACTDDTCDGTSDACLNTANDGSCDDGNQCTLDTCDAALGCQSADDDGAVCSVGACNGVCGAAVCVGCTCTSALDCDDGVGCTVDTCVSSACLNMPNDATCDNGLFCDGGETCDPAADCQAGTAVSCDDGIACTDDSCNEGTDSCDNLTNDANCDNGLFCDGNETCDAVFDCQAGTAVNCDDGVSCTDDTCDEGGDTCNSNANDANCDNSVFCDGAETCDAVLNCQSGTPPTCDDSDSCTTDICDGPTDACVNTSLSVDPASTVDATSTCLTVNAGGQSVVFVDLRDTAGVRITGATVTFAESGDPVGSWVEGAVTESASTPGVYYRTMIAPASGTSTSITVNYDACAQTGSLPPVTITYAPEVAYPAGGTGGCNPQDGNIRVRAVDESGGALGGAFVMIGGAQNTTAFYDDFEAFLAAGAGTASNVATTDASGYARFVDYGVGLDGAQDIHVGAVSRSYLSLVQIPTSDLVAPLPLTSPVVSEVTINGDVLPDNYPSGKASGDIALALVAPVLDLDFLASFQIENLLENDVTVGLGSVCGDIDLPGNVHVPVQNIQVVFFTCSVPNPNDPWTLTPEQGPPVDIFALHGEANAQALSGAASISEMISLLTFIDVGLLTGVPTAAPSGGNDVTLTEALSASMQVNASNAPLGEVFVISLADIDAANGAGRMIIEGISAAQNTTNHASLLPTASTGVMSGAHHLAAGISLAAAGGISAVFDRSTVDSTSVRTLDAFFSVPGSTEVGRVFSWIDVAAANANAPPDYDLSRTVLYRTRDVGDYAVYREEFWIVYGPTGVRGFTLPTLPATAPRSGNGGYLVEDLGAVPAQDNVADVNVYFLGLAGAFDIAAHEFGTHAQTMTVISNDTLDL